MKSTELNQQNTERFKNALESGDNSLLAQAMENRMQDIENNILNKFEELKDETDEKVLNARGIFSLTDEEKKFYDRLFKNENSPSAGGTLLIPKTIVDRVFEDIRNDETGVMGLVDFQHTSGVSEILLSVADKPVAAWGELTEKITKELKVGFKVVSTQANKLTCYIPYCQSIIDLGYSWQDAYVREYMSLGLSMELSKAAISGNGVKCPVGMAYDYDVDTDSATLKTAVKLKEISPKAISPLLAKISKNPMGYKRSLSGLTLFVDSETYYKYVYANNLVLSANGIYIELLQQMGISIKETETGLDEGKAVLGLPKRQFMEMGFKGNPKGMLTFSDENMFLDDLRVYKGKLYADGMPKDNNAFILLDLTSLPTNTAE